MDRWLKAFAYSALTAAVLWWLDPAGNDWSTFVGHVAALVTPFRLAVELEARHGCPLSGLRS